MKHTGTKSMIRLCLALLFALALALPGASSARADEGTLSDLQNDLSLGGDIKLYKDYTAAYSTVDSGLENGISVPGTVSSLDLNGHTIRPMGMGRLFIVHDTLTLLDSSEGKTGTITGGNADDDGGSVFVSGSFTMTGGTISGSSAQYGGGVYVSSDASFTMTGGSITGNTATDGDGGGVCVYSGGSFTMTGGSITGNTAAEHGGGVYVYSGGSFSLSGAPTIGGEVYLGDSSVITVTGELTNPVPIPVTMENPGVFTSGWAAKMGNADPAEYFTSENADYKVYRDASGEARLSKPYKVTAEADPTVGGSVAVSPARSDGMYGEGETVTLLATPSDLYAFDSFTVTDADNKPVALSGNNTFTMPAGDVSVTATFVSEWSLLQAAINSAQNDGTVTLEKDYTASGDDGPLTVPQDKTLTLDLNGHILDRGLRDKDAEDNGSVIEVYGTLTVKDSNSTAAHTQPITYTDPTDSTKTVTVTGGVITGGNSANGGGGVRVDQVGSFSLTGGSIVGNKDDNNGGGVSVQGGIFAMSGGSIVGNNATLYGGGVSVSAYANGSFTMSDGTISGNSAHYGGGVSVIGEKSSFSLTGGTISGNSASGGGSGVFIMEDNSFTMSGGSISGNTTTGKGGGVYVYGGSFAMSRGTISGNTAKRNGGGVLIENYENISNETFVASFALSGSPAITGNTEGTGESARTVNVYLIDGKTITVGGELTNTAPIGVTMSTPGVFTSDWAAQMSTADPADYFTSDDAGYAVRLDTEGELTLKKLYSVTIADGIQNGSVTASVNGTSVAQAAVGDTVTLLATPTDGYALNGLTYTYTPADGEAITTNVQADANGVFSFTMPAGNVSVTAAFSQWKWLQNALAKDGTVTLTNDITCDDQTLGPLMILTGKTVTLDLNGHILDRGLRNEKAADYGYVIEVKGTLTVTDSNSTAAHTQPITYTDPVTQELVTVTGGVITGGNGMYGGVNVQNGSFTLNGGSISGNTASGGGGVNVYSGSFTLSGGSISGNVASDSGGGVNVQNGTFTMTDGTITGNTASMNNGGGVCAQPQATSMYSISLEGGTISNNKGKNGGGVYISNNNNASSFTMTDSTITGNTASINGGGVYFESNIPLIMEDGTISDNSAVNGGGVYISSNNGSKFYMEGGTISGNTASSNGGGVYISGNNSRFTMTDSTISGNTASSNGGGVYIMSSTVTMTDSTITGNTASGEGGGVYHYGGFYVSSGSAVTGNHKGSALNNVYLKSGRKIMFGEALTDTASIGVTMEKPGVFTSDWADTMSTADPALYFTSDDADYAVRLDTDGELTLKAIHGVTVAENIQNGSVTALPAQNDSKYAEGDIITLLATPTDGYVFDSFTVTDADNNPVAVSENNTFTMPAGDVSVSASFMREWAHLQKLIDAGGTITLNRDYTASELDSNLKAGQNDVTLDLNGHTITGRANITTISVEGNLTLKDSSEGKTGRIQCADANYGVSVGSGTFTMEGGTISGNNVKDLFVVQDQGQFIMNGGTIFGENAQRLVQVSGRQFTMNGGTITGTEVRSCAVGTFSIISVTINGGEITAVGAEYGGIYVADNYVTLTLSGNPTITGGIWLKHNAMINIGTLANSSENPILIRTEDRPNLVEPITITNNAIPDSVSVDRFAYSETGYSFRKGANGKLELYKNKYTEWDALQQLILDCGNNGVITLDQDYTAGAADAPLVVPGSHPITLDLNGHTIDGTGLIKIIDNECPDSNGNRNRAVLEAGSALTVQDSKGGGRILSGDKPVIRADEGLTLNGGSLSADYGSTRKSDTEAVLIPRGTFTMNGGSVSSRGGWAAVNLYDGTSFTMAGGAIQCSNTTCAVHCFGSMTMKGGTVIGNVCDAAVISYDSFFLTGGKISGNSCDYVVKNNGSMDMSGGTISGRLVDQAVLFPSSGTELSGGTVSGRGARFGGVYAGHGITLSGALAIDGGIWLDKGNTITVTGALTNSIPYEILTEEKPLAGGVTVLTSGLSGHGTAANFTYDASSSEPFSLDTNDEGELVLRNTAAAGIEWEQLKTSLSQGGTVTLEKNYTAGEYDTRLVIPSGVTVTLDLNGRTIDGSRLNDERIDTPDGDVSGGVLLVGAGGSLTVKDSQSGGKIQSTGSNPLTVLGSCTLESGTVSGSTDICGESTFTMTGGTMSDGQVRVSGTFTMNGGNISNHDSQYTLFVSNGGEFTVNAGTISGTNISSCVVFAGGYVYVYGGTISGSGQSGCIVSGAPACIHVKGSPAILGGVRGLINIDGELNNDTPIPVIPQGVVMPGSSMIVTDGLANGGDNAPGRFISGAEGLTLAENAAGELELRKEQTDWDSLQTKLQQGGLVVLDQDYTAAAADNSLQIPADDICVTIDLNGHSINGTALSNPVFVMVQGSPSGIYSNLTLKDSGQGGKVICGTNRALDIAEMSNSFDLRGGEIIGSGADMISMWHYSSVRISGGKITGTYSGSTTDSCMINITTADITMTGGEISGSGYNSVLHAAGGEETLKGGKISGSHGESVVRILGSNFSMTGGEIIGTDVSMGAVYIPEDYTSSRFTVSGAPVITGGVWLGNGVTLNVSGTLANSTPIEITAQRAAIAEVPVTATSGLNYDYNRDAKLTVNTGSGYRTAISQSGELEIVKPLTLTSPVAYDHGSVGTAITPVTQFRDPETGNPIERSLDCLFFGDIVALTLTPETDFELGTLNETWTAEGGSGAETAALPFTVNADGACTAGFAMPEGDVSVTATFVSEWSLLQAVINNATDGGTVTLDKDITATGDDVPLVVPAGKSVTLDLNGHSIDRGLTEAQAQGHVMEVNGTLTVTDSSTDKTGVITGGNTTDFGGGVCVSGSLILESGSISGNASENSGGGVYVKGGSFSMTGGAVSGNKAYKDTSNETETSGTNSGITVENSGGGVYVCEGGSFDMQGGEISGNDAIVNGGGVYVSAVTKDANGTPTVNTNGSFTMSGGTISGNTAYNGGGVCTLGRSFEMTGGTISGNTAEYAGGVAILGRYEKSKDEQTNQSVYKDIATAFTMSGGTIENNTVGFNGGGVYIEEGAATFTMSGTAAIKNNTVDKDADGHGGGVCVYGLSFDMTGGTISGNTAYDGGGVYMGSVSQSFTMSGGSISGNTALTTGGGVSNEAEAFTVSGGKISGNTAHKGGGVYVGGLPTNPFTLSGGEISGNTATGIGEMPGVGGGVFAGSSFSMTGGEISGNTVVGSEEMPGMGGGVYFCKKENSGSTLTLSGSLSITGNTEGTGENPKASNIYLQDDVGITVGGALSVTAPIGVAMENPGVFTSGWQTQMGTADPTQYFTSEDSACYVRLRDAGDEAALRTIYKVTIADDIQNGSVTAGVNGTIIDRTAEGDTVTLLATPTDGYTFNRFTVTDVDGQPVQVSEDNTFIMPQKVVTVSATFDGLWSLLQEAINNATDGGTVKLERDYIAVSSDGPLTVPAGKSVTLDLNGHILNRRLSGKEAADNGSVIIVNGTLTVKDSMPTATHTPAITYTDPTDSTKTVTVTGGVITGGNSANGGGGVRVDQGGSFTLESGTIVGNKDANNGGGVSVQGGSFAMSGGSIVGNNAALYGGGVSVSAYANGSFTMSGGSISGNSADMFCGGVYVYSSGTFNMQGGSISGNSSNIFCGGVYVSSGSFTMTGGHITGNHADGSGGGVFIWGGSFTLSGSPEITGNTEGTGENPKASNIYLQDDAGITVGSALSVTAPIGVAMKNPGVFTSGWAAQMGTADPANFFTSENAGCNVYRDASGEARLSVPYTVTVDPNIENGSVSLSPARDDGMYGEGETVTILATPTDGYALNGLTYTYTPAGGEAITTGVRADENGVFSFTMPAGNVSVTATFSAWKWLQKEMKKGGEITLGRDYLCDDQNLGPLVVPLGATLELNLNGHVIDRGLSNAQPAVNGSVIVVNDMLTVTDNSTEKNGVITGGNSSDFGGGVYVSGSFTLESGSISGNASERDGGGVFVGSGSFTMTGGSISGNSADMFCGGVYVNEGGRFTLCGSPEITGNTKGTGESAKASNVYLANRTAITIVGALSSAKPIGVTMVNPGVFTYGWEAIMGTADPANFFTSENAGYNAYRDASGEARLSKPYAVTVDSAIENGSVAVSPARDDGMYGEGETVTILATPTDGYALKSVIVTDADGQAVEVSDNTFTMPQKAVTVTATFSQWKWLQEEMKKGGEITLGRDYLCDDQNLGPLVVPVGATLELDLNGHTIDRGLASQPVGNNGNVITVSGNLTLTDNSSAHTGTITGGNNEQVFGGGVSVNGGTFTMDGGRISGCNAARGGGVNVDSGTFTMNGGTISDCSAYDSGGGVSVNGGTFTMTGGTITDCNAILLGGGVYVEGGCKFTMENGTITGCKANNSGGGVYVNGSFTMNGSTITDCSANLSGGGVYIQGGSFTLSGSPEITGNTKGTGESAKASNVYLANSTAITIGGALSSAKPIGVTMETPGVFTSGLPGKGTLDEFASDDEGYGVFPAPSGEARLSVPYKVTTEADPANSGSVTVTPARSDGMYSEGETVTLLATPTDFYVFDSFTVKQGNTDVEMTGNTFTMPVGNVSVTAKFLKSLAHSDITVEVGDQTYTGSAVTPSVTVKDGSKTLAEQTDYTAAYSSNINAGTASVTLTGKGNYTGTRTATFTIAKKPVIITANNQSVEYNDSIATGTDQVSITDLVTGHSLSSISLALAEGIATNAVGEYANAIVPSGAVITDSSDNTVNVTDNYSITYARGKLTVTKIKAKVTTHPTAIANLKYTGESQALITAGAADTAMEYALGESETTAPTSGYSASVPGGTNAASYFVWYRAAEDANHTPGDEFVISATIQTAPLTVTANPKTITYGDAPVNNGVVYSGFVNSETESVLSGTLAYDYSYTQYGNAGSDWTITPKGLTGSNYTISFVPGKLTVLQKEVGLSWNTAPLTYSGTAQAPTATATGLVNNDEIGVSVSGAQTNAGMGYTATASSLTGDKAGNYKLPGENTTTTFAIGQKEVGLTWGSMELTYNGLPQTPTAQATGVANGDEIGVSVSGAQTNVGTGYTATASTLTGDKAGNYKLPDAKTTTFAIGKAPLTVTANPKTITYGDAPANDGVTYSGLVNSETESVLGGTLAYAYSYAQYGDVGNNYTITPSGLTADNYDIRFVDGTLTVNPKPVTVNGITAKNKDYDGTTEATLDYPNAVIHGKLDRDELTVTATGTFVDKNVGVGKTVNISGYTLDGAGKDNYQVATTEGTQSTATATISAVPLTVTANPKTITYGDAPANDGVTYSGLVNSEPESVLGGTLAYAYSYAQYGDVGNNYTITPKGLTSDNYEITFNPGTLTVEQKEVGLTWGGTALTYQGTAQAPAAEATGLQNNDVIGVSVSGAQTSPGTGYTATASDLTGEKAGNYKLPAAKTTTFAIGKAPLTITANPKTITYGDEPANDGVTYSGLVNSEPESVLGGTLAYTYSYAQYGDVGNNYTITPSGLTSGNYDISFVAGTLTVEQKEVGLTWSGTSLTYNGSAQEPTAEATGLVNNDVIGVAISGAQTNAGTYTATASGLTGEKAGNYKLPAAKTTTFAIGKLSLTITAAGASKTFDGTALTKNGYFTTGLAEGDRITSIKVTGSITSAGSAPNTASDAVIKNSAGEDVTYKYDITYRKGTLVVVKKPVLVKADDKTKVYDNDPATDPELTAAVTGEVKGYPVSYTLSREAGEAVGSYKITVTAGNNPNYVLSVTGAELTITEAPAPVYGEPDFTLPGAIRTIEANAFEGGAMSIVYIPDTCTAIGAGAFKDCANLTQIRIPKNCEIGDGAFTGCGKVYVFAPAGGTTESWCQGKDNNVFVAEN